MTAAASVPELLARLRQARADVAEHKAAIRSHRDKLRIAAAALEALELEARGRGITIIHQPKAQE